MLTGLPAGVCRFLRSDFSVSCDEDRYTVFQKLAQVFIGVYIAGLPLFYAILLVKNRFKLYMAPADIECADMLLREHVELVSRHLTAASARGAGRSASVMLPSGSTSPSSPGSPGQAGVELTSLSGKPSRSSKRLLRNGSPDDGGSATKPRRTSKVDLAEGGRSFRVAHVRGTGDITTQERRCNEAAAIFRAAQEAITLELSQNRGASLSDAQQMSDVLNVRPHCSAESGQPLLLRACWLSLELSCALTGLLRPRD